MDKSVSFKGRVTRVIYESKSNDFCVLRLEKDGEEIIVRGTLEKPYVGQSLSVQGEMEKDTRYGLQCVADSIVPYIAYTHESLVAFLSSGKVKGVGPVLSKRLLDHFGKDLVDIFRNKEFSRLGVVEGITSKRIESIEESWTRQQALADVMIFFQSKNIPVAYGLRIYRYYRKANPLEVILNNPYELVGKVSGIGFAIADFIAQKIGFTPDNVQRIRAGFLYIAEKTRQEGSVYQEKELFLKDVHALLNVNANEERCFSIFEHLHQEKILVTVKKETKGYVGFRGDFLLEEEIAKWIKSRMGNLLKESYASDNSSALINNLHETQKEALHASMMFPVSIISGPPGSGKTTIVKALLSYAQKQGQKVLLAAPTGRAAKRMMEATGGEALTLHRLLEWDLALKVCNRTKENPLQADILVVDEASMIDLEMMAFLLRAIGNKTRLVLLGDVDQLPSVRYGSILKDLIDAGVVPVTMLTHVFRQSGGSEIISNACRVNKGYFPLSANTGDFIFIYESNVEKCVECIFKNLDFYLARRGLCISQVQVITPMHRGKAGSLAINKAFQDKINGKGEPIENGFRVGDKVIQMINNYDLEIFNGDHGIIESFGEESICINFGHKKIEYPHERLSDLSLAYAISVHKSQGSEFDVVVMLVFMEHFILLNRQLLYTAITRARKLCILIGDKKALACAIRTIKKDSRVTFLKELLSKESSYTC